MTGLARLPSGLFLVRTNFETPSESRLVSWVQQCSFEPPRIMMAVKRDTELHCSLRVTGTVFELYVLGEDQKPKATGENLDAAHAVLRCRVIDRNVFIGSEINDHTVIFADVLSDRVLTPSVRPLVHIRKTHNHY